MSERRCRFEVKATCGGARTGEVHTPRGSFPTPAFMPVGTRAAVRLLTAADLEWLGSDFVLANTYHLMLRPGADVVRDLGGLHSFMSWDGHVLTDSGGYQVFSLEPKVDETGASFRSTYDGTTHLLSPELAVEVQGDLGADIQMALDICPPLPSARQVVVDATERTHRWAARARRAFLDGLDRGRVPAHQVQFGIVQGGVEHDLRAASAEAITEIDFDGYAAGGFSVGEDRSQMLPALEVVTATLPDDRPRYVMGLGDPVGLVESVARGVDMFDCVLPTRLARHGGVLTAEGKINLRNARFARDDSPIDPAGTAPGLERYSRGYLRHLLLVHEPTAARIVTLHNLWWTLELVRRMREAIGDGTFDALRAEVADAWG
ncbi:MAG: tRNA guanosine(34) transglycosylase Tgt [Actinomycetota bacterium]|nr:tRNA guanosine(34) transglycosylase Tgt [Actinomycetota bacterium]